MLNTGLTLPTTQAASPLKTSVTASLATEATVCVGVTNPLFFICAEDTSPMPKGRDVLPTPAISPGVAEAEGSRGTDERGKGEEGSETSVKLLVEF